MTDLQTMHRPPGAVNLRRRPRVAQLRNVALATDALGQAIDRVEPTIPSICVIYGYPGLGKTMSIGYCMARFNGVLYTVKSMDTPNEILRSLANELGVTISDWMKRSKMLAVVTEALRDQERPLLIDEFDRVVQRSNPYKSVGLIELFRDLADGSRQPMMIVGEQRLPTELEKFGRFFDRILAWVPAVALDVGDAGELVRVYCPDIEIDEQALAWLVEQTEGNARRFTTTVTAARQTLIDAGRGTLTLDLAQSLRIPGARAPMARRFK